MLDFYDTVKRHYYRNKGQKLLLKGQPEKAFPYLEKALLMDDNHYNMYNLALALLAMQRFEEAENYLVNAVEKAPGNALAVLTLAELYMQKRQWDKASGLLKELCEIYPSNKNYQTYYERVSDPEAREKYIKAKELLNQARIHLQEKKFEQALEDLLTAEKHDPENPYVQSNLGSIYLRIKRDPHKAFKHFHKAYKLNPENRAFKQNMETARKLITD